jgi:lipopolysaccharide/colanic/teichoic acid biosynthesis glycosyltransferase
VSPRHALDALVALVALLVLAPLLVAIGLLVALTSPGPVLFSQERVGLHGRRFRIYKFRTMVRNAHLLAAHVSPAGDPRVTPLGRVLRGCYLDELPQLLNVLRGDMALVGPRPETPEHVALYSPAERRVLTVRPGLAGPSTLGFMDEAEQLAGVEDPAAHYRAVLLHERVRMDLGYLDQRSLRYDLRLLCRQVLAIVCRRGHAADGPPGPADPPHRRVPVHREQTR